MAMGRCLCPCGPWSPRSSGGSVSRVRENSPALGLIIHEAQLTYPRSGFHRVLDLGRWWKSKFDLPLPLGANALLRSLPADVKAECCRLMRERIEYALDHREEA